jgi:hypothetical protein
VGLEAPVSTESIATARKITLDRFTTDSVPI